MDLKAGKELVRFASIGLGVAFRRTYSPMDAERFLSRALGSMPGAPTKIAQLLGMRSDRDIPAPEPMSVSLVRSIIENESPKLAAQIHSISEIGITASLGQTHKVRLKSGEILAVKVQYPHVAEHVASQIEALFGVAGFSPARKYDFDIPNTRDFLRKKLLEETDYTAEAETQTRFNERYNGSTICIPRVFRDLSTKTVLAQSWEESTSLHDFGIQATNEQKDRAGAVFTAWVFDSLFGLSRMHADLNPTNYGFRGSGEDFKLVIYDFGSVEIFPVERARCLHQWYYATRARNQSEIYSALVELGFAPQRLSMIDKMLLPLSEELLKPILVDGVWSAQQWNLQNRLEEILGQNKWWFRTAGPPWFLYFMRSLQGWHHVLKSFNCQVDVASAWRPWQEKLGILDQAFKTSGHIFPDHGTSRPRGSIAEIISKSLRVRVFDESELIVDLTLPVNAARDLEAVLPDAVLRRCQEDGIRLHLIQSRADETQYAPQELFKMKYGTRSCLVWLE